MIPVPMQNAGQGGILNQFIKCNPHPLRMHTYAFGRIADSEHTHPFTCNETLFPQVLQGVTASVILGNHAKTGRAAVHGIELSIVGKRIFHNSFDDIKGKGIKKYHKYTK
jgi:hypothetical protein